MKLSRPSQFLGERGQVGALGLPVDAAGREILEPQRHLRMGAEGLEDVLFVVLAAERQQHAGAAAAGHELLQRAPRRIHHHALRPVFAADAAPEGVVAIEGDHFKGGAADGVDFARDGGGQGHEVTRGVYGRWPEFVGVRVVDLRDGVKRLHLGRREGVDGGQIGQPAARSHSSAARAGARSGVQGQMTTIRGEEAAARTASTKRFACAATPACSQSSRRTSATLKPLRLRAKRPAGSSSC